MAPSTLLGFLTQSQVWLEPTSFTRSGNYCVRMPFLLGGNLTFYMMRFPGGFHDNCAGTGRSGTLKRLDSSCKLSKNPYRACRHSLVSSPTRWGGMGRGPNPATQTEKPAS